MSIIKPYSAFSHEDVTAENFPFLKHAWVGSAGVDSAAKTWTDVIGGKVVSCTGTFTENGDGSIIVGTGSTNPSGLELPGTKDVVLIQILYSGVNTHYMALGDDTALSEVIYAPINNAGANYVVADAAATKYITNSNPAQASIGSSGNPGAIGIVVDWNGDSGDAGVDTDGQSFNFYATSAGVVTSGSGSSTAGNVNTGLSTLTVDEFRFTAPAIEIYGTYVCYFQNGYPADYETAISWMVSNPTKGMYPGWLYLP